MSRRALGRILSFNDWEWLSPKERQSENLLSFIHPHSPDGMQAWPVSRELNRVGVRDDVGLLESVGWKSQVLWLQDEAVIYLRSAGHHPTSITTPTPPRLLAVANLKGFRGWGGRGKAGETALRALGRVGKTKKPAAIRENLLDQRWTSDFRGLVHCWSKLSICIYLYISILDQWTNLKWKNNTCALARMRACAS